MALKEELEDVENSRSPHLRGRRFEVFLEHLLREDGLTVYHNPKTAKPYQTDLSATQEHLYFLIEAKWHNKPINLSHIGLVRERLQRTTPDVFACIFSMSNFSSGAIEEVSRDRSQEIILFNNQEIRGIAAGKFSFLELLKEKRKAFRTHAIPVFIDWTPEEQSEIHFRSKADVIRWQGSTIPWLLCKTGDTDVLFCNEYLDFSGRYDALTVSLDLRLHLNTIDDLQRTLNRAEKYLGLENSGAFAIHQRDAGWFGFGPDQFLKAVKDQKTRYADLGWKNYHHSEELSYLDRISTGGLVCISSRQATHKEGYLHSSRIEILLPGLPVNMANIQKFCDFIHQPDVSFDVIRECPVKTLRFPRGIKLEPVATIVSTLRDQKFASGLIVKNPFFKQVFPKPSDTSRDDLFHLLSSYEFLFCALKQWHNPEDLMDYYELHFAEACWVEHVPSFYIACDWRMTQKSEEIISKRLMKRRRSS